MPPHPQVARLGFTRVAAGDYVGAAWTTNIALVSPVVWIEPAPAPGRPRGSDSFTIGELARESGVTLRALRFYQSKGLLAPQRNGRARVFSHEDRDCLALILQGKRLGFTLTEIRGMLAARARGCTKNLPINRTKCVEQIKMLERRRRDIDRPLAELRRIYTDIFIVSDFRPFGTSGPI